MMYSTSAVRLPTSHLRTPVAVAPRSYPGVTGSEARFKRQNKVGRGTASSSMTSDCTDKSDIYQQRRKAIDLKYKSMQKTGFPEVPDMEVTELYNLLTAEGSAENQKQRLVVVDTRQQAEQEVSMIPWGTLRAVDFEKRRDEFKDYKIICYCTIGHRSGKYADWLRKQGYDSCNLKGSILAWTHNRFPLVNSYTSLEGSSSLASGSSAETCRVHTFNKAWALQGDGYEAEYFENNLPWMTVAWDSLRLSLPSWAGGAS